MPSVRTVVRTLTAGIMAATVLALCTPVTPAAQAQENQKRSSITDTAASGGISLSIDSVSPRYASPGSTIVVKGTLTNDTGFPVEGVSVQLDTSTSAFESRSSMNAYSSSGNSALLGNPVGTPWLATSVLHNRSTLSWTASFTASEGGYSAFGVYPLAAQVLSPGSAELAAQRTFLPYWPGSDAARQLSIAWVWPLIDQPQGSVCPQTVSTNSLASSLSQQGRLGRLLDAGLQYASQTHLTWAVDPALLSDADVMTSRYKVGGNSLCTGTTGMPAARSAITWLAKLRSGTSGDPLFVTPYADPDVAALTHAGLDGDLIRSYSLGNTVASQILKRPFGINQKPSPGDETQADGGKGGQTGAGSSATGSGGTSGSGTSGSSPSPNNPSSSGTSGSGTGAPAASIAWPDDGVADASVLTSLARDGGITTTILNSDEMPQVAGATPFQPEDAVARVTTGIGTSMNVLLADSGLTSVLGSATAASSAGAQFTAEQDFLAETAMISAEAPNSNRSVVVAPPRRWAPSAGEAGTLLAETSAPWLRPVTLASLASSASGRADAVSRQPLPGSRVSSSELGKGYMRAVESVGRGAALFRSMLYEPSKQVTQSLEAAVAVTESTAWRGSGAANGWLAVTKLSDYIADRERLVQIISNPKVLMTGASGSTPVSVSNGLPDAVQVQVEPMVSAGSQLSVGKFTSLMIIPPDGTSTVSVPLHSAGLGSTMMQLQLLTKAGSPLVWTAQSLSVQATQYGRALFILIAAALGVLVLTSLARRLRKWLRDGGSHSRGAQHDGAGYDGAGYGRAGYDAAGNDSPECGSARHDGARHDGAQYDSTGGGSAG